MNNYNLDIRYNFKKFFAEKKIALNENFLLAVSGGIDSIVLCELFKQEGLRFSMAHCNFKLRKEESERDEEFVKSLADKNKVSLHNISFDTTTYANEHKISVQEAARALRYDWFERIKNEAGYSYIVTAHHADDNIETLLMNFFRGTGLQGLTAIPQVNKDIIRPMLEIRRNEILNFAKQHHLQWVEDSSNQLSKYTRNFFRNDLIPAICKFYPGADNNLLHNIERFKMINAFYNSAIEKAKQALLVINENEIRIPIRKLKKYDYRTLLFEITKKFGFSEKQVPDIIRLMDSASGKFVASENFQVIKHGLWLVIASITGKSKLITIEEGEEHIVFEDGSLSLTTIPSSNFKLQRSEQTAQLDARHIKYPILLRKWKQGDYFYPLGLRKKKKLARFFIDKKLSKNQKEHVWVLESNKKIIWIVGLRIDERFKITDGTRSVLTITYQNKLLST